MRHLRDADGVPEERLRRYLLELLPPDEADRLDEAAVTDDDVAAQLRSAEHDLVDAYVREELAGAMRQRFESHYLASPRRRAGVAAARRFLGAVDRAAAVAPAARAVARVRVVWTLAASAAVLLLACGALLVQTVRLSHGLIVAEGQRVDAGRRADALRRELSAALAARDAAAKPVAPVAAAATPPVVPAVALVLLPQTRAGDAVSILAVPPAAARVDFELRVPPNDFARYQAGLRDPASNRIVWRSAWTAARAAADGPSVLVAVPASLLQSQHYVLDLTGGGAGPEEIVADYAFEIVHR